MKKLHNTIGNVYFPKNESCFWVGDAMHSRQLTIRQPDEGRVYTYLTMISKLIQNTLQL